MSTVLDGRYLTVTEAAEELGLTRQRVHALIQSGQLTAESIHERLRVITRRALDDFKKIERPHGLHIEQRNRHKNTTRSRKAV